MTIIEPKVKFTRGDVDCIKKLGYICQSFNLAPWDVIEAVENHAYSLHNFFVLEYEVENNENL